MKQNDMLLSVRNATKSYRLGGFFTGVNFEAVSHISFKLKKDNPEIFTIIGESGSGKTTLSRMILRLILPNSGNVFLNGMDVKTINGRKQELDYMSMIQPIFQNPFETFNPLNKVEHYLIATARNFYPEEKNNNTEKKIDKALNAVGLSFHEIRGRYPHELSGGQLQRVSIARAIIPKPKLLLADEPVSMVDASLRMSIVNLFKELKDRLGTSIIYITHDLATAYYISDRIAIMHRGVFVEQGEARAVLENPRHPYTRLLVDSVLEPKPSEKIFEYKPSDFDHVEYLAAGCKFANRCPLVTDRCLCESPSGYNVDNVTIKCFKYEKGNTDLLVGKS